ncbi:MAG: hypothetical protein JO172_06405, partial [Hyphomicrobiales bacterium]|nr:hypothetical protein [Hyphomicrobiales bacterium]
MRRRDFIAMIGASAAWKSSARAQKIANGYRLAIVSSSDPISELTEGGGNPHYEEFLQELRRLGDVEGQNLLIER